MSFPGASPWPADRPRDRLRLERHERQRRQPGHLRRAALQPRRLAADQELNPLPLRGRCRAFLMRDQTVTTPVSPVDPQPAAADHLPHDALRARAGIRLRAASRARPVALTKAKAVNFHELERLGPVHEARGEPPLATASSFMQIMGQFPGTENWFYVDHRRRRLHPVRALPAPRAPGPTSTCPSRATAAPTGRASTRRSTRSAPIPPERRPRAVNPGDGFIISWNKKEAIGWRKGPTRVVATGPSTTR